MMPPYTSAKGTTIGALFAGRTPSINNDSTVVVIANAARPSGAGLICLADKLLPSKIILKLIVRRI